MRRLGSTLGLIVAPAIALVAAGCAVDEEPAPETVQASLERAAPEHPDDHGTFGNVSTAGAIDLQNEFFQSFGTNGRACSTCHLPENAFTLRADTARALFDETDGQAPLFRTVDGSNAPNVDVSTVEARRRAYSLLLTRTTFRFSKAVPSSAEFTVASVADPYGFATTSSLTLYRKPPPTTNLRFSTSLMWDGRASDLAAQANGATQFHSQTTRPLTAAQQRSIVAFESALYTAQTSLTGIGTLVSSGGGPAALSVLPFTPNANAPQAPPASPVTTKVFALFSDWVADATPQQQSVLRGQAIFNARSFGTPARPKTCSSCHSALNLGSNDHTEGGAVFQALGTSGEAPTAPAGASQFLAADLPVYTLKNRANGRTVRTNDPGRGLVTGKWLDIGRFKVPNLRGLAARAPYFHNGMAKTLLDVVEFYDVTQATPAGAGFTAAEKADLASFLAAL